jgi:hypothetical protein
MPNPVVEKFISELKLAKRPYLTSDSQVVCGRIVLTAEPSIESDSVRGYKLEIPRGYVVEQESPVAILFVFALFGAEILIRIRGHIGRFLKNAVPYSETMAGFHFRAFLEGETLVMLAEPIRPEASPQAP